MTVKETIDLEIQGMYCAACATRIEKVVSRIEGVTDINVNLATEKGRVSFLNNRTSLSEIINRIVKLGYGAKIDRKNSVDFAEEKRRELRGLQWKFTLSAILTFPLAWAMFAHFKWASFISIPTLFTNPLFQFAVTIPIQFILGFQFYDRAWKALRNKSANMDVLVVLSTSAAFFYSHYLTFSFMNSPERYHSLVLFYDTSAFIITFVLLGKFIEAKTKWKTTTVIQKLHQLQPQTAVLDTDGKQKIPIEKITPGDVIILKPGEKVPIDGQVIRGNSMINESLLTGESIPVEKQIGHDVYAGTVNQNGQLKIKVTKKVSETALSQIIRIVEDAQTAKAPIQHIADQLTEIFVPIIITIAVATFLAWYFLFQPGDVNEALQKLIAVLIIACPCAMGLATPTSIMVGSGRAAQLGVFFKEGKFLELLSQSNIVAFDKTGTITKGNPQVTDLHVENVSMHTFLKIIGAVENGLDHPLAKAIVKEVKKRIAFLPDATEVDYIPGYGVEALVDGKRIVISNPRHQASQKFLIPSKAANMMTKLEQEGKTVLGVSMNSRFIGIIAIADEIKKTAQPAVSRLKKMGFKVIMLTGDHEKNALNVATQVGIHHQYAQISPREKANIIQQLQLEGHKVSMVGDGINDAPALTVADVGIAIGSGADVAVESGDVTMMKNDLNRVVDAIILSQKTMKNIKQNFLWAFLYNIFMIPFAMFGFLPPWLAGAAMATSSVTVVLNSLRLKKIKIG